MKGESDKDLKWPVEATFTLALLNEQGGEDREYTINEIKWNRPMVHNMQVTTFYRHTVMFGIITHFLAYSELDGFLYNDTLYFLVKDVFIT